MRPPEDAMEIAGLHSLGQKQGRRVHAFLGVGHDDPLSEGTPDRVHQLVEQARDT